MSQQSSHLRITVEGQPVHVRRGRNDRFWSIYERGVWEPDSAAIFKRFLDRRHSYIDLGAWIGPTLILGCQLAKCAYGVEPDPIAYAELLENIDANRPLTNNVKLFNVCIAPVTGKVSLGSRAAGGDSMSSLLFSHQKTTWIVDGVNFQQWMCQNEINDCNFIKMDIEGGEYSVVPTMSDYLNIHRPTLYLSLHPCFLGDLSAQGLKAKLQRSLLRLGNTITILRTLSFYKHWYDPFRTASSSDQSFLRSFHHRLAKQSWRPFVFLVTCLNGFRGKPTALVFTDQGWPR